MLLGIFAFAAGASGSLCAAQHRHHDVVVYGGTSGGYATAIQLSRLNRTVALIEPSAHVGGIAVNGFGASDIDSQVRYTYDNRCIGVVITLDKTDTGAALIKQAEYQNSLAVGPLALEFYRRISQRYGNVAAFDAAWANHTKNKTLWRFESHVAESALGEWLAEEKIDIFTQTYLKQEGRAVEKEGTTVKTLITEQGTTFSGRLFIDATYEGDLLAAAGVSTTIGRESAASFNETNGGVRVNTTFSQLTVPVDPYIVPGDSSSGLIPTVQSDPMGAPGSGDKALAAYVFRMCLTNVTSNLVPFTKPANYNASEYILWSRYVAAGGKILTPEAVVPNFKTDTIGSTALGLGFDLPGRTLAWPEGNYSTRANLARSLAEWQKGQLYFFANDQSMPEATRSVWSKWGYAKDEFADNDHFPRTFYVRDGRRMVKSDFIITARTAAYPAVEAPASDPIAVAFWPTDVHIARRIVYNGSVYDEGSIFKQGPPWQPFGISFKAVTPMRAEATNLMSPTVMAVSHLGYGAVRIENTFMNIGQALAFAADVALDRGIPVQDVPYSVLGPRLAEAGAVLDASTVGMPDHSHIADAALWRMDTPDHGHRRAEHNSGASLPTPKRIKIRLACQECRDRKIRCDGARPICHSCSRKKLGLERCVYLAADTESTDGYISRLEDRVRELETVLGNSHHASSRPAPVAQDEPLALTPVGRRAIAPPRPARMSPASMDVLQSPRMGTALPDSNLIGIGNPTPLTRERRKQTPPGEEAVLRRHQDQSQDPSASAVDEQQDEDSPGFLGSSSAIGFMSEVCRTFKAAGGAPSSVDNRMTTPNSHEGNPSPDAQWFERPGRRVARHQTLTAECVVPPRKVADSLLEYYWNGAHPLQPFIHRGIFMKRYHALWSNSTDDDNGVGVRQSVQSEQTFHCILNLIFALGCRFRSMSCGQKPPGPDNSHEQFASRATRLLSLDLLDYGSVQLVQALNLMAQYLQTLSMSNKCWVIAGTAIRVAQGIRLHLDIAGESQAQREERRRTWHSCELLDSVLSMTFGRPPMLEVKSAAPLPQMIDDEYLTMAANSEEGVQPPATPVRCAFYLAIIKLSHITTEILRCFYFTESHNPSVEVSRAGSSSEYFASLFKLDSALDSWNEEVPPFIQYEMLQGPLDSDNLYHRQAHLLRHRYLYAKVLLFRRLVVQTVLNSSRDSPNHKAPKLQDVVTFSCVDKCTDAARGLLDCIRPNIGTWLVPPAWYTVFVIYTCGTVFAVVSLAPSLYGRLAPDERRCLLQSREQCVECLRDYHALGDPSALRCLQNLLNIYNKEGMAATQRGPNGTSSAAQGESRIDPSTGVPPPPVSCTAEEQNEPAWDTDLWAGNWADDFVHWPEDFAVFESFGTRSFQ
ncbi:FAD dependent oxidoreductase-domain-containing protein [Microdochium bolleyi]|uniref:FAD dependent oxidoreductase-domain-containing protein n=1 Tax=Microdochium bolleyi TaxID=196109 RepID=A0A136IUA9_9PEZI|nr:FAD dependent oxidoreductase-domain-containing protein [Microdochium bolleyi]